MLGDKMTNKLHFQIYRLTDLGGNYSAKQNRVTKQKFSDCKPDNIYRIHPPPYPLGHNFGKLKDE